MSSISDLETAHGHCIHHSREIAKSSLCACFQCLAVFAPVEITDWVDADDASDPDATALCPKCGIDAVIGDASGVPMTFDFFDRMERKWFGQMTDEQRAIGKRRWGGDSAPPT